MQSHTKSYTPSGQATPAPGARTLAGAGLAVGLVVPLLLLGPMLAYQMEFMLYTWVWPVAGGVIGLVLSALAWRRAGADGITRRLAGLGLAISVLTTALALAGWLNMIGQMLAPPGAMPMG